MASLTERSTSALRDDLVHGETVMAATRAQLDGGTMRIASGIGVGVGLGSAAGALTAGRMTDGDELAAQLANGVVIAVTGSRVMLLDVTAVGAKPKGLVLAMDRTAIVDVTTGEKRVMLVKMMTIELTIAGDEPSVLRFEIPKTARREAEAVAAALGD